MVIKKTNRKEVNFFHKIAIESTSFDICVNWGFNSTGIALMVESNNPNDVIQYSFDGKTVHGDMKPTFPSEAIIFDNRVQNKIWFRRETDGNAVPVRVEAWTVS